VSHELIKQLSQHYDRLRLALAATDLKKYLPTTLLRDTDFAGELARVLLLARALAWHEQSLWPATCQPELRVLFRPGVLGPDLAGVLARLDQDLSVLDPAQCWPVEGLGALYEPLLALSDGARRQASGAYFTPTPLIQFMLKTVNIMAQRNLDPEGLAGDHVQIADPAAGSGLFLVQAFWFIKSQLEQRWQCAGLTQQQALWQQCAPKVLARLRGIELQWSACCTAWLALEEAMKQSGAEPATPNLHWGDALAANALGPANLLIGNPPYGASTASPTLLHDYKTGLHERKHALDDILIQFLALGHQHLIQAPQGLLAFVINSSLLEGATRARLRQCLLRDFSELAILDLGGSRFAQEQDANLFAIQAGIALLFLTRTPEKPSQVRFQTLRGQRPEKLQWLANASQADPTLWPLMTPQSPNFIFRPASIDEDQRRREYQCFTGLEEVFIQHGSGIKTDRDALCYDHDRECLADRMTRAFAGKLTAQEKQLFKIRDSSSYPLLQRLAKGHFNEQAIQRVLYRPFDERWLYYDLGFTSRPARAIMAHVYPDKLALLAKRQARPGPYSWILASRGLVADGVFAVDNRGREQIFPLFRGSDLNIKDDFRQHYSLRFEELTNTAAGLRFFAVIYAILHSPGYRQRYEAMLCEGFPRLPWPRAKLLWQQLQELGEQLLQAHTGQYEPQKPEQDLEYQNIEIGGTRALSRWLKDRGSAQSRELTRLHWALSETRRLSLAIDQTIDQAGGWPDAFLNNDPR